jgi:hypothetical protein
MLTAAVAVLATVGLLAWIGLDYGLRTGRTRAWILGLAAALVVGLGSMADYLLWFTDSRLWTMACYAVALILVAAAGWRGGWAGGVRAAAVAHLGATMILLVVFWWNLGVPVQAAVFQAAGILDTYAVSKGTFFVRWVTDDFLGAVLPRTLAALAAGFGLGVGVGWMGRWYRSPQRKR